MIPYASRNDRKRGKAVVGIFCCPAPVLEIAVSDMNGDVLQIQRVKILKNRDGLPRDLREGPGHLLEDQMPG